MLSEEAYEGKLAFQFILKMFSRVEVRALCEITLHLHPPSPTATIA